MRRSRWLWLTGAVLFGACGPSPKYTIDDDVIASIPTSEKQSIFAVQQEITILRAERAKKLADADATKVEIDLAEAERGQAKLEVSKAKLEQDAADKLHEVNRQHGADQARELADRGERVAEAKVEMLAAKRRWQKELADVEQERIGAAMARLELEKAKLAVSKNIRPSKDFNLAIFVEECARRQRLVEEQKQIADEKKSEMEKMTQAYHELEKQFDEMKAAHSSK